MNRKELVSVIIPTYKRPQTLCRCVESVLNQTYSEIEIIVVDDNDPNSEFRASTEQVMSSYSCNDKVIYIKHEKNKNGSAARNTGFRASHGSYVMFLDDDDEFLPRKVETQINCLRDKDGSWGACYTDYKRVNGKGETIAICGEKREGNMLKDELGRNFFVHAGSNLMVRRKIVEEIEGFDETFPRNQDVEFLVRILKKYKIAHACEMGLIVHIHDAQNRSTVDLLDLTKQYINKFKDDIDNLPNKDRNDVYLLLNLQVFRFYLLEKKDLKAAKSVLQENSIPFLITLRYMIYMLRRKISKKAYGFQLYR